MVTPGTILEDDMLDAKSQQLPRRGRGRATRLRASAWSMSRPGEFLTTEIEGDRRGRKAA